MKKIGLVKGDFNPITKDILIQLKKLIKNENLNKLYLVVKDDNSFVSYYHRYNMTKRMVSHFRKIEVISYDADLDNEFFIDESTSKYAREGNSNLLSYSVQRYISENYLYVEDILKANLKEKRIVHSKSVAELSKIIARSNGVDEHLAYQIGLYHDLTKYMGYEDAKRIIDVYSPYESTYNKEVWHQYTAYYVLKHFYKFKDKTFLKAIRHHCLGDDINPYSMIIYIADKLDPSRGYDSNASIKLSLKNVKNGFEQVHKEQEVYLKKEGIIL